jgi:hypothetical protein
MKLYLDAAPVAAAGTYTASYRVLPEQKRVYIECIILGWATGTTGRATITLNSGGVTFNLVDDYPLAADDQIVTIYPQFHLDVGDGFDLTIANAGAADTGRCVILGVK